MFFKDRCETLIIFYERTNLFSSGNLGPGFSGNACAIPYAIQTLVFTCWKLELPIRKAQPDHLDFGNVMTLTLVIRCLKVSEGVKSFAQALGGESVSTGLTLPKWSSPMLQMRHWLGIYTIKFGERSAPILTQGRKGQEEGKRLFCWHRVSPRLEPKEAICLCPCS